MGGRDPVVSGGSTMIARLLGGMLIGLSVAGSSAWAQNRGPCVTSAICGLSMTDERCPPWPAGIVPMRSEINSAMLEIIVIPPLAVLPKSHLTKPAKLYEISRRGAMRQNT